MKKIFTFLLCAILSMFSLCCQAAESGITSGINQVTLLKKYSDVSANFIVLRKMKSQTEKLSAADKDVINKYVYGAVKGENTYLLINCYLRGTLNYYLKPKDITTPLKSRMKYYADCLTTSISKSKLPKNMLLYRGIDEKGMSLLFKDKNIKHIISQKPSEQTAAELNKKLQGTEFVEKGFMSTSYDINYAKQTKFMFLVKAPKNLQAVFVDGLNKERQTKEILINKGYKWKVTNVILAKRNNGETFYKIEIKLIL